jgi:hypothetical protein
MTRLFPTSIVLAALTAALLVVGVSPASASDPSKGNCGKLLINDWYDGTIDGSYPLHCYRDALKFIGRDLRGYSSAYDDINQALQRRIAELAAAKHHKATAPPTTTDRSQGGSIGAGPAGGGTPPRPSAPATSSKKSGRGKHPSGQGNQTKPTTPKAVGVAPAPKPKSAAPQGRDTRGRGPAGQLVAALGPKDATSIPIPLIVLAGIALLLLAAGGAGLVARRAQARRVPVPARSAPPR